MSTKLPIAGAALGYAVGEKVGANTVGGAATTFFSVAAIMILVPIVPMLLLALWGCLAYGPYMFINNIERIHPLLAFAPSLVSTIGLIIGIYAGYRVYLRNRTAKNTEKMLREAFVRAEYVNQQIASRIPPPAKEWVDRYNEKLKQVMDSSTNKSFDPKYPHHENLNSEDLEIVYDYFMRGDNDPVRNYILYLETRPAEERAGIMKEITKHVKDMKAILYDIEHKTRTKQQQFYGN